MKKIITLLLLVLISITVVGCTKKEEEEEILVGGWTTQLEANKQMLDEEIEKYFDEAAKAYKDEKLERVALLAEQVVAGKNYMFLAKTEKAYKIVIVYHDLEGKSTITNVNDFKLNNYVSKDIANTEEMLAGGWNVEIPGKPIMLEENDQAAFDGALNNVEGTKYYPIATIATQVVAGTNYAILCYGRPSEGKEGIYLLTIYKDIADNLVLTSSAYVDLKEYNK